MKLNWLLLLLVPIGVPAQVAPPLTGAGAPSGSCTSTQTYLDTTSHNLYSCNNGTWSASPGPATPSASGTLIGTYPAPIDGQSHLTYDAAHATFYFERTDGAFSPLLCYRNDASTGGSTPTEMCISADNGGQFNFTEYSSDSGAVQSQLTLNHSGLFGLCSPVGAGGSGGITNDANGNTIIPAGSSAGVNCQAYPASALKIATDGTIASFLGQAPAGTGIPIMVYRGSSTLTGSFGPFTMFTTNTSCVAGIANCPGANGLYHFSWYGVVTTAAAGATLQITLDYNDGQTTQTANCFSAPVAFGTLNTHASCDLTVYSAVSQTIKVTFTTASGSPSYFAMQNLQSLGL